MLRFRHDTDGYVACFALFCSRCMPRGRFSAVCSQNQMILCSQGPYGFWKVMEIEMPISKTWKVLEVFQNCYGKVLDFCLEKF